MWRVTSPGLSVGHEGGKFASSLSQHLAEGIKFAYNPIAMVMKWTLSRIKLCSGFLLCLVQWNKWSP